MTLLEKTQELKNNPFLSIENEDYDALYFGRCKKLYSKFRDCFGDWEVIEEDVTDSGIVILVIKK